MTQSVKAQPLQCEMRVFFSGVCAFISGPDKKSKEPIIVALHGSSMHGFPDHQATLAISAKAVVSTSVRPLCAVNPPSDDEESPLLVWNLAGCKVRFLPGGTKPAPGLKPALPAIPELVNLQKDASLNVKVLSQLGADKLVSAAVLAESGNLDSLQPSLDIWRFENDKGTPTGPRQPLSSGATLTMQAALPLALIELAGEQRTEVILIRALEESEKQFAPMRVSISSFPLQVDPDFKPEKLPHFSVYYDLTTKPPHEDDRFVPHRVGSDAEESFTLVSPKCGPPSLVASPIKTSTLWTMGPMIGSHRSASHSD